MFSSNKYLTMVTWYNWYHSLRSQYFIILALSVMGIYVGGVHQLTKTSHTFNQNI